MDVAAARGWFEEVVGSGVPGFGQLDALRRLRGFLDAWEAAITNALAADGGVFPDQTLSRVGGLGRRDAAGVVRRAELLAELPAVGEALAAGEVTSGHVDALAKGFDSCEPGERAAFTAELPRLLAQGAFTPADRFAGAVASAVRAVRERSEVEVLADHVRENRLSMWQDRVTGRWKLTACFDPASGALLNQRLTSAMRRAQPGTLAPTDGRQRAAWKLAQALLAVTDHGSRQRPTLVVDDRARRRVYDWGAANAVPDDLTELLVQYAKPVVVIVRPDGSIADAEAMNLGRSQRPASNRQRLALTGLSATCMIPGCDVPADQCEVHNVVPWSHGGRTDLDNLILACGHDHDRTHAEGWDMHLAPDRTLTITYPDGTVTVSRPQAREPP
jgi:hypothetical protein